MGYKQCISFNEIYKAANQCARGVRWKDSVQDFLRNKLAKTYKLYNELQNSTYNILPYFIFYVFEPKERLIISTRFRDRVFQKSMCNNGLYNQITKGFIYDNCACLKHKGVLFAINRLTCHLQRFYRKYKTKGYCLKLDIKSYFASIPHSVAKQAVGKRITDEQFKLAVFNIIDSFVDNRSIYDINNDPFKERGIGLGSQISQLIALSLLDDIDHKIKEYYKIKHYVRYMDDLVIIHENKQLLLQMYTEIENDLSKMGLSLSKRKCYIAPISHGIVFLKIQFKFVNAKLTKRVLNKSIIREKRKIKKLISLVKINTISLKDVKQQFESWLSTVIVKTNDKHIQFKMVNFFKKQLCNVNLI